MKALNNFLKIIGLLILLASQTIFSQWQNLPTGVTYTIYSMSAVNDNIVWACSSGSNIIRTTNGGTTWINVGANYPINGNEFCIYAFDVNTAIVTCFTGTVIPHSYVYKTTNAGASWTLVQEQYAGLLNAIAFKNQTQGILVGWPEGGRWSLFRTNNAGNTWDSTGLHIVEWETGYLSFNNCIIYTASNIWFGCRVKGIYLSTNDGNSWTLSNLTQNGLPYPSALYFENSLTGYSSAQFNLIKTTNGGLNWADIPGTSSTNAILGVFSLNNYVWFVRNSEPNIYYSSNYGSSWIIQYTNNSLSGYRYMTRSRSGNKIWACTDGGEIQSYVLPIGIVKISENIPENFILSQNYPNPFNPRTKIKFSLPGTDKAHGIDVRLVIYNITGSEVTVPVNEKLSPGEYETSWDGDNYSSGIYLYSLEANGVKIDTKKMILLK